MHAYLNNTKQAEKTKQQFEIKSKSTTQPNIEAQQITSKGKLSSGVTEHFILLQLARVKDGENLQMLTKLYINNCCERI